MEEVLPHIAKRVLLLILLWILPFFIADLFIDKNYFCATGDMFAIFFWQGYSIFSLVCIYQWRLMGYIKRKNEAV